MPIFYIYIIYTDVFVYVHTWIYIDIDIYIEIVSDLVHGIRQVLLSVPQQIMILYNMQHISDTLCCCCYS